MHEAVHTLIIASAAQGGSGSIGSGLGINAVAFISQLVSFGIVFVLLRRWGLPAITRTLDRRERVIREVIENAERAKRDLEEANQRAEQILADARRQAQETVERASKAAQQEANRIREEANRARAELSRLVVNLSIDAASRVIGRSVDSKDNRRLVEEFVTTSDGARNN